MPEDGNYTFADGYAKENFTSGRIHKATISDAAENMSILLGGLTLVRVSLLSMDTTDSGAALSAEEAFALTVPKLPIQAVETKEKKTVGTALWTSRMRERINGLAPDLLMANRL